MMPPVAVVETERFLEHAKGILTESERADLVAYVASNPEAGLLIPGTGGARTIYYYHNESIPLFVFDIYAKSEKADLSESDKRGLKRVLSQIPSQYAKRS